MSPGCDRHHLWYSYYLMLQCRYEQACQEIHHALELDPVSVVLNRDLGMIFYFARQYDQAIEALERTIEMDPSIMYAHAHLGAAYLGKSMYAEALSEVEKERALAGESLAWIRLKRSLIPNSPRIVPGAASAQKVTPTISRTTRTASRPWTATAISGPLLRYLTSGS